MVNELRVPVPSLHGAHCAAWTRRQGSRGRLWPSPAEMVARGCRGMVQGVQLSAPFGRYQMALDVAEAIGPR